MKIKIKTIFQKLLEIVVLSVTFTVACIVRAVLTITFLNRIFRKKLFKYVETFEDFKIENEILPVEGEENWVFTASKFKVLQITDVHIGAGALSYKKDKMAINAIASMIKAENPDLVILTGDLAYPIPILSGNKNNLLCLQVLARLFEVLNSYWTFTLGNHDVEFYAKYANEDLVREIGKSKMCLARFPKDTSVQIDHLIEIKTPDNITTRCLVILDSHSYIKEDKYGMHMQYDNIKDTQLDWYENKINKITLNNIRTVKKENNLEIKEELRGNDLDETVLLENQTLGVSCHSSVNDSDETSLPANRASDKVTEVLVNDLNEIALLENRPSSSLFFHIPIREYKDAWLKYLDNGKENTDEVKLDFGVIEEKNRIVYHGEGVDNVYAVAQKTGCDSMFCGHDHYNNMSVLYTKNKGDRPIRLTYGLSLDYFAYPFIAKRGRQRGCMVITYENKDIQVVQSNYYQDKYISKYEKEKVKDMDIILNTINETKTPKA
ncbi:MAG TPA: metallophosphoesterase [Clostridia bacterium]|jgi:predicted MPP superfamily phosphohydrolase|nr:metallophosphoesterase [Clostridia bacterium]